MKVFAFLLLTLILLLSCSPAVRHGSAGESESWEDSQNQTGVDSLLTTMGYRMVHEGESIPLDRQEEHEVESLNTSEPIYFVTSYYAHDFHGKMTANGERFNMYAMTCAHKSLPFNTRLRVTNEDNGRSVIVRVNDRGPFIRGRDLDLSYAAAKKIGLIGHGVKSLRVEILPDD